MQEKVTEWKRADRWHTCPYFRNPPIRDNDKELRGETDVEEQEIQAEKKTRKVLIMKSARESQAKDREKMTHKHQKNGNPS